jgi:hypothetical protein
MSSAKKGIPRVKVLFYFGFPAQKSVTNVRFDLLTENFKKALDKEGYF